MTRRAPAKRQRLIFRLSTLDRRLVEEAASARGMSVGAFVRQATLDSATRVLRDDPTAHNKAVGREEAAPGRAGDS